MGLVTTPKRCDTSVKKAIQQISEKLGHVNYHNFTASRLVSTNSSKKFASTDLAAWVAGTTGQITVTDDADGTVTLSIPNPFVIPGKVTAGAWGSPLDVTGTRKYGFELHYSGNNYDVFGIRSRANLITTADSSTRTATGAELQAANSNGISVNVLCGAKCSSTGKSTSSSATISTMRAVDLITEWGAKDTVTNLYNTHIKCITRNSAGEGSFGTGYGVLLENIAVGGTGQALSAGIYFKGTNLSGGNYAFVNGIDMSGATISGTDVVLSDGSVINDSNGRWGVGTPTPTADLEIGTDGGGEKTLRINSDVAGAYVQWEPHGNYNRMKGTGNQNFILQSDGVAGYISFNTYESERLRLKAGLALGTTFIASTAPENGMIIEGVFGLGEVSPETQFEMTGTASYITLHNSTHEDTDGGGESRLIFKREDGAGTETSCAQIEGSHDGVVANNQLGKLQLSVNTGAALADVVEIDSSGNTKIGDAGTTNYTNIAIDGTQTMIGTARVTKYAWMPAGSVRAQAGPGTGATETTNNNNYLILSFANGVDRWAQANIKIPDDMDLSADSYICLGWSSTSTTGAALWDLKILITAPGDSTDQAGTSDTGNSTAPSGSTNGLVSSPIYTITGGTIQSDEICIHTQIMRDGSSDTLGAAAELHGMALLYTANKLGEDIA